MSLISRDTADPREGQGVAGVAGQKSGKGNTAKEGRRNTRFKIIRRQKG